MDDEVLLDDVRTPGPRIRTPLEGCRVRESVCSEGETLPVVRHTKRLVARVRPAIRRARTKLGNRDRPARVSALVDCPDCGEGRVTPLDVTVRARIETDDWSYRFTCPTCTRRTVATTSRAAALQAVEAGASLETWRWSAETNEVVSDGPPLSLADLRDLRGALSDPDWLDAFSRSADDAARNEPDR